MSEIVKGYELKQGDLIQPDQFTPNYDSSKPSICMVGWHTCIISEVVKGGIYETGVKVDKKKDRHLLKDTCLLVQ